MILNLVKSSTLGKVILNSFVNAGKGLSSSLPVQAARFMHHGGSPLVKQVPLLRATSNSGNGMTTSGFPNIILGGYSPFYAPIVEIPIRSVASIPFFRPEKYEKPDVLYRMHRRRKKKKKQKTKPLDGCPQMKGIVLKTLIKKPKKPNSANRKCVLLRLSNGKEAVAYVPGIGHNLQEHHVVLVECGRTKDVPGLKLRVIRGKYDCAHVIKPTTEK